MKIYAGSDHAGVTLKAKLAADLRGRGHEVVDVGTSSEAPTDYPDWAARVARAVRDDAGGPGLARLRVGHRREHRGQQGAGRAGGGRLERRGRPGSRARTTTPTSSAWARASWTRNRPGRSLTSGWRRRSRAAATRAGWPRSRRWSTARAPQAAVERRELDAAGRAGGWSGGSGPTTPRCSRPTARPTRPRASRSSTGWAGCARPRRWRPQLDEVERRSPPTCGRGASRQAVLLGMGGSSLCPEVLAPTFGATAGGIAAAGAGQHRPGRGGRGRALDRSRPDAVRGRLQVGRHHRGGARSRATSGDKALARAGLAAGARAVLRHHRSRAPSCTMRARDRYHQVFRQPAATSAGATRRCRCSAWCRRPCWASTWRRCWPGARPWPPPAAGRRRATTRAPALGAFLGGAGQAGPRQADPGAGARDRQPGRLDRAAGGRVDRQAGPGHRARSIWSRRARPRSTATTGSSWWSTWPGARRRAGPGADVAGAAHGRPPGARARAGRHAWTWARSSSAGSSPPRWPAPAWGSTPSTSPTSPRPRRPPPGPSRRYWQTGRPARPGPGPARAPTTRAARLLAHLSTRRPGDYICLSRVLPADPERRPAADRAAAGCAATAGTWPPPWATARASCTRPGSCTRAGPNNGVFVQLTGRVGDRSAGARARLHLRGAPGRPGAGRSRGPAPAPAAGRPGGTWARTSRPGSQRLLAALTCASGSADPASGRSRPSPRRRSSCAKRHPGSGR